MTSMPTRSARNATPSPLALAAAFGVLLLCSAGVRAEFVLNWSQNTQNPAFNTLGCQTPVACSVQQTEENTGEDIFVPGQTPFLYELTTLDGLNYYHMIVDDPAAGFAQEVYIQVGSGNNAFPGAGIGLSGASSSSRGQGAQTSGEEGSGVNPFSPDATFSGNSSGNPERVQMRQLLTSGELTVDFLKDRFLDKPNITNTVETAGMNSTFIMDSTGNRYDSMDTASQVTNTLEILDPDVPAGSALFTAGSALNDTATPTPSVTAGRYTYTPTAPPPQTNATFGGSGGTYQYFDGGANINPDWSSFFDHREANPWSYERLGNRPTP